MLTVDEVLARRPAWVRRQINDEEARILSAEVEKSGAARALEIGCASGFSSAVIYAQLEKNDPEAALLLGFDLSEQCYFDKTHNTGDAMWEIHGNDAHVRYTTGVTSADISAAEPEQSIHQQVKASFAFIDANHKTPWAALDMLSLARFLTEDAVIAIHDVDMIYFPRFRDCNGSRDLFRCWRGEKWRYKTAPNIAFMRRGSDQAAAKGIANSLLCDWDESIPPDLLAKYCDMAAFYGEESARIVAEAIKAQQGSARRLVDAHLGVPGG